MPLIDVLVVPADVRCPLRADQRPADALARFAVPAGGPPGAVALFASAAFLYPDNPGPRPAGRRPNPRAGLIASAHHPWRRPYAVHGDVLLVGPPRGGRHTPVPSVYTTALLASSRLQVEFHRPGSSYRWRWTSAQFPEPFTAYRAGLRIVWGYPPLIVRAVPAG